MIADRTYRAVFFLSRLRFAAPTGHKARQTLAHRLRGQRTTRPIQDGSPSAVNCAVLCLFGKFCAR